MNSDEGVLLPWIHEHVMVPWNDLKKGDCCGGFETISDGYYCEGCNFFVHKKCSELSRYIEHPSHPDHTLRLRIYPKSNCNLCGRKLDNLFYCCEVCNFNMDLYCTNNPPPNVINISETHHHELKLFKWNLEVNCHAKCGKIGEDRFSYDCDECNLKFHASCVWHPVEDKQQHTTIDDARRVSLPLIHKHILMPWNDMRKGDCCGRFKSNINGFYCESCDFFVHEKCSESSKDIQHPSHPDHLLQLQTKSLREVVSNRRRQHTCDLCGKQIMNFFYHCEKCDFDMDLNCATYPPPDVIEVLEIHRHILTLLKEKTEFDCDGKCGKIGDSFSYECHECGLTFHVDCIWNKLEGRPLEVNHSYHHLHPLKLLKVRSLYYSDGKCRLCGKTIDDELCYHCSSCNFTLDMRCVLHPPQQSFLDLKAHDHQLTLLPRLDTFTCNACGLKGDRSPYVCFECGFMIHQDCLDLPRVININRHDHRISRTSVLGVVNSVCGVCRKKVDWTSGGYSCQRCPGYVVHSKCATRKDVWNGRELEGVPEALEDIEPYLVIDENTIQHFTHKEHYLRLHTKGGLFLENKWCSACNHPIGLQSFYGCISCDFVLHQNCAKFPRKKWHVLHNERLTLVTTSKGDHFICAACGETGNGFVYKHWGKEFDVRCASISEPFVHPSHPQHPLYYIPREEKAICNGCNMKEFYVLRCIEDGCEFVLDFKCATLPPMVKHRVDDYPLTLCYGEKASDKYWCDICEKETNPKKWFYTCKDHRASLHTMCVLGDFGGMMPGSTINMGSSSNEMVLNNSVTRPFCKKCKSHCLYPVFWKNFDEIIGTSVTYHCSFHITREDL